VASGDPQASIAAAAAKSFAAESAVSVCETSIQVLGGIGFTWEHELHRLYKRALGIESFGASGTRLRAEVAAALLNGAEGSMGSGLSQTPDIRVSATEGG
jgi:alkylation response protein AidB-like acyl-CoA dehydrogenase